MKQNYDTVTLCVYRLTDGHDRMHYVARIQGVYIGVNSYWAQGLKPPHFYDHGALLYDEPPTFVT